MTPKPCTELMAKYWAACRARGEKPRAVHALVAGPGAQQPAGYVITWGLHLPYVENRKAALGDGDKWTIEKIEPNPAT
jgi:hypothetical protein